MTDTSGKPCVMDTTQALHVRQMNRDVIQTCGISRNNQLLSVQRLAWRRLPFI